MSSQGSLRESCKSKEVGGVMRMGARGWNDMRKESAKEYRRLPEARNIKETSFPLRLQKEPALPHP